jgi:predicted RNA-binding protein Jag
MDASVDDAREFVAESREDAIAKAAGFFRVPPEQLDVWVVPPTVTVSGLGSNVLVIAALKSARSAPREERRPERRPEPRAERREERGARSERPERPDRGARPDRAERPERSDRFERPERPERPERGERSERPARAERSEPRPQPARPSAPAPRIAAEPADESAEDLEEGELGPVGEFVAGILERMKLRGVAVTETETEEGDIIITLDGKAILALNDREPRFAAALSHLAHRAAEVMVDEEAAARVDIRGARRTQSDERPERPSRDGRRGGSRPDRPARPRDSDERDIDEVALERMAREAAEIVRRSGEPELLRPMNSRERWVVHNTLKDERGVRSESEGEGPRKRVRITPD